MRLRSSASSGLGASDARMVPFQFILEIRSARVANFLVDRDDRVRTSIRMRRWVARPPNQWLKEITGSHLLRLAWPNRTLDRAYPKRSLS
jgi:hypothetical protein